MPRCDEVVREGAPDPPLGAAVGEVARLPLHPGVLPETAPEAEDGPWRRGDVGEGGVDTVEAIEAGYGVGRQRCPGEVADSDRRAAGEVIGSLWRCADIARVRGGI